MNRAPGSRKVLIVLQEPALGGATRTLLRPLEVLLERGGWEASFWCARPSALYDDLVEMGFRVDGTPRLMRYRWSTLRHPPGVRVRLKSLPASQRALRRRLAADPPDIVHVNGRLALPEAITARTAAYPVCMYLLDDPHSGLRGLVGRLGPWASAHVVAAMTPSHAEGFSLGRRRPLLIGGCVRPSEPIALTRRAPGAPVVIGMIGDVHPRKGADVFVDAAERLHRDGVRVDLRIAGPIEDGPWQEWANEQVARGEAVGVRYLGRVDVASELRGWDVMVLPSRAEPHGLVVTEAMAAGIPVVGSDTGGIAEQLEGGVGVLVAPEDPDALAAAIRDLAADPRRRAELGAAGHARVLERYLPEHAADALEAAWEATLAKAPRRAR